MPLHPEGLGYILLSGRAVRLHFRGVYVRWGDVVLCCSGLGGRGVWVGGGQSFLYDQDLLYVVVECPYGGGRWSVSKRARVRRSRCWLRACIT